MSRGILLVLSYPQTFKTIRDHVTGMAEKPAADGGTIQTSPVDKTILIRKRRIPPFRLSYHDKFLNQRQNLAHTQHGVQGHSLDLFPGKTVPSPPVPAGGYLHI